MSLVIGVVRRSIHRWGVEPMSAAIVIHAEHCECMDHELRYTSTRLAASSAHPRSTDMFETSPLLIAFKQSDNSVTQTTTLLG